VTEYPVSEPIPAKLLEVDTSGLVVPVEVCTTGSGPWTREDAADLLLVHRLVLLLPGVIAAPARPGAQRHEVSWCTAAPESADCWCETGPRRAGRPAGSPPGPRARRRQREHRGERAARARALPGAGGMERGHRTSFRAAGDHPPCGTKGRSREVRACSQSGTWQRAPERGKSREESAA